MTQETTAFKTFNYQEDGSVNFSILATTKTTSKLCSAVYNLKTTHDYQKGYITHLSVETDRETYDMSLPFYFKDKIDKIFNSFYNTNVKKSVNSLGYKHKLGILLHGKQGTGKTSMLKDYFEKSHREFDSVVFNLTSLDYFSETWEFIKKIRRIQDNSIVVFIDECEDLFEKYKQEDAVKKALDGFDSIDNSLILLASNYIDKIPDTIKNRPSRIKYVIEVEGIQEENIIRDFLKQAFKKLELDVEYESEISKMKGFTIDELKQWVLDKIMDIEPETKKVGKLGFGK